MKNIVDISEHQKNIDWSQAHCEIELAIIRVQYGSLKIDERYKEYVAGCKQFCIPFGHYAYARFVSVNDAEVEANDFLKRIDPEAKFLVVDVEEVTTKNAADLVPATQGFIDVCKKAGHKVGLYSGDYFYRSHGLSAVKADFLWLARYSNNAPVTPCDLWQYTSSGRIAGITENTVDLNRLNGSKDLCWFTGMSEVTPKPQPMSTLAPQSAPTPKRVAVNGVYTVVSGDNLTAIANDFNISVDNLVRWNGISNPNLIQVGQKIRVTAAQPAPAVITHKVVTGDTLSELAVKYGTTVANLKALNGLTSDTIYIGQTLKVSGSSPAPSAQYHKVVAGDTVSELAQKYGSSITQIKQWNNLDNKYTIRIGQTLRVK